MLRLPPSQIGLSALDVKCHLERIPFHRSTRTLPQSTREPVARGKAYVDEQTPEHDCSLGHRYSCPSPNPIDIATDHISDESILAEDAVPQRDRKFWNRVIAHAGSPSTHHHHLNPRLAQPEQTMMLSDVSASADSSTSSQHPDIAEDASRPGPSTSDEDYDQYLTGNEGDSVQHHVSEHHSFAEGRDLPEDGENHHGAMVFAGSLPSDQADLTSVEDDSEAESKLSDRMDLDGSAEGRGPHRSRRASLTSNLSALRIGEHLPGARTLSEAVYGSSDNGETPTPSSSARSSNDDPRVAVPQIGMFPRSPGCATGLTLAAMMGRSTTRDDRPNPSFPSSPLEHEPEAGTAASSTEAHRRRLSNLPRSGLHFSHTAPSSSPDRHGGPPSATNVGLTQETSLMGESSRDSTTDKRKSESNFYAEPETNGAVENAYSEHDEDSTSDGELTELTSSPPQPVYDGDVDVRYLSREQYSLWPQPPPGPHTTAHGFHHPQGLGIFVPSGLPPDALPPPFSASARTVSFNLSLPSSSPASQYFSPLSTPLRSSQNLHEEATSTTPFNILPRPSLPSLPGSSRIAAFHARLAALNSSSSASQSSSPAPHPHDRLPTPTTPDQHPPPTSSVRTPSPPPPRTPRSAMRVYDDRLPASTQPQTPRHFRRAQPPPRDAAFTAPAAHARNRYVTPTNRLIRRPGTRTPSARIERRLFGRGESPFARSDFRDDDEQENTSVEEEVARRLETLRRWRQVAEREREVGREGRLESTPPREERFGWD